MRQISLKQISLRDRKTWIFIGCGLLGLIHSGLVCNTLGLYFKFFMSEFEISMTQVTLIMSFLIGGGLFGIAVAGRLLRIVPTKLIMTLAALFVGGGVLASSWFKDMYLFYGLWAGIGFCTPFLVSIVIPTILGNWFGEKFGSVMGIIYGITSFGGTIFNPVVGQLLGRFGFRMSLRIEGAIALAVMLPITLFVMRIHPDGQMKTEKKAAEGGEPVVKEKKRHIFSKTFLLFTCGHIFLTLVNNLQNQISTHALDIGFSIENASNIMGVVLLGCALGNLTCGLLFDRLRTIPVVFGYAIMGVAGWMGMAAAGLLHNPTAGIMGLMMFSGILIGMGRGLFQIGTPYCVKRVYGGAEYSEIIATVYLPASAFGIFTSPLGGLLYDATGNCQTLVIILSVSIFIGGLFLIGALKAAKQSGVEQQGQGEVSNVG